MADSSGTVWSWISPTLVADCWQPEMLRPEYVELDKMLRTTAGWTPLRDFIEIVGPSPNDSQPKKWHADSNGICKRRANSAAPVGSGIGERIVQRTTVQ